MNDEFQEANNREEPSAAPLPVEADEPSGGGSLARIAGSLWNIPAFRLSVVLFLITGVVALLLGVVNDVSAPIVAARQAETRDLAMRDVLPEADSFALLDGYLPEAPVSAVYQAKQGGRLVGYAVTAEPAGYGGEVRLIVGVSLMGEVVGVQILGHSETPGLGTRVNEPGFLEQFTGKQLGVKLGGGQGDIAAVSGATISSRAVTEGVSAALAAAAAQWEAE